jgi:hypothetical protein
VLLTSSVGESNTLTVYVITIPSWVNGDARSCKTFVTQQQLQLPEAENAGVVANTVFPASERVSPASTSAWPNEGCGTTTSLSIHCSHRHH